MSVITSRVSRDGGIAWRSLFAGPMVAFMVIALCWPPLCFGQSQKEEAAGKEIAGPAISNAPLQMAAGNGDLEQVKELLSKGIDVNSRDPLGTTALMYAALGGNLEICKFLVEKKADVNAKNEDGVTALMYASGQGYLPIVEFLIEKGADVNAADKDGKSALSYAKGDGREQVANVLTAKGGKEPPDLETMGWRHHRWCYKVPICVRWRHGECKEWVYEIRCHRRQHHRWWK